MLEQTTQPFQAGTIRFQWVYSGLVLFPLTLLVWKLGKYITLGPQPVMVPVLWYLTVLEFSRFLTKAD